MALGRNDHFFIKFLNNVSQFLFYYNYKNNKNDKIIFNREGERKIKLILSYKKNIL